MIGAILGDILNIVLLLVWVRHVCHAFHVSKLAIRSTSVAKRSSL